MDSESIKDKLEKLYDKIKNIRVAMMTIPDPHGRLISRPMYTQDLEFDNNIWFFTKDNSPKADELREERQINLSYADPDESVYVSVSGTARIVRNRRKAEELWNPALTAWFPEGLEDPHLALIKVEPEYAEYWDASSNKMVQLFGMIKSAIKGEEYRPGENKKINL